MTTYYAHRSEDGKRLQTVKEHLENTARKAASFGASFDSREEAYYAGYYHDLGKYSLAFQRRLLENGPTVDHSTAGAQKAFSDRDLYAACAIAGHHGGLPDVGNGRDTADEVTLCGRVKRQLTDFRAANNELDHPPACLYPKWLMEARGTATMPSDEFFYTRMIYSCLVDADFLDTESFMQLQTRSHAMNAPFPELENRFLSSIERKGWTRPRRELDRIRYRIVKECHEGGNKEPGLYSLTVPTGGGKTGASLAFALRHAVANHLERIIYVIPYTSIIEQNADVFRDLVGSDVVLEHHSNVDFASNDDGVNDKAGEQCKRLASENWDASIIVTTAVQFFESLFAARPAKCRKLHNIARSVIIFDEAQMLPVGYLKPCMLAITELVNHYGCTAVLCTATQPSLGPIIKEYSTLEAEELAHITPEEQELFKRVTFVKEGKLSLEALTDLLNKEEEVLCVVNSRKDAQAIYQGLEKEGRYHLSTFMTPANREKTLAIIRERLVQGLPCRVVSTSLIEAGVDVDFPTVYRAEAGLDSILQAAGRCNREGKRDKNSSLVHVYKPDTVQPRLFSQNISATEYALNGHDGIDSPGAVSSYFDFLYQIKGPALDSKGIIDQIRKGHEGSLLPFKTIAEEFQIIDSPTKTIYIENDEDKPQIKQLELGYINRDLLRALARHAVQVYADHFERLSKAGSLKTIDKNIAILVDKTAYSEATGLMNEPEGGRGLFG